jgi:hypothetical protein
MSNVAQKTFTVFAKEGCRQTVCWAQALARDSVGYESRSRFEVAQQKIRHKKDLLFREEIVDDDSRFVFLCTRVMCTLEKSLLSFVFG